MVYTFIFYRAKMKQSEGNMTIVFKASENVRQKMIIYYENLKRDKTPPYAVFQAQEADTIITLYESGKVMFQGVSADIDANIWITMEKNLNGRIIDIKTGQEKTVKEENYNHFNTIGSDEVGTGDYFGPIVVAATYVDKSKQEFLKDLKVDDSKKLTDEHIIDIAPKIMKEIPYSAFILSNEKYNALEHNLVNMNKIKAILHNKVLLNLSQKDYPYEKIIVDQFTPPKNYFAYLSDAGAVVKNITFSTKAEGKALSVACASIISRYIFLEEMKKISETAQASIPKGAGENVDVFATNYVKKHGFDSLRKIAKLNFKNTEKIKKQVNY